MYRLPQQTNKRDLKCIRNCIQYQTERNITKETTCISFISTQNHTLNSTFFKFKLDCNLKIQLA